MRFLHLNTDGNPIDDGQLHNVYGATRSQATDGTDTLTIITSDPISKDDRILYRTEDGSWAEHICTKTDVVRSEGQAYGTYTCENSLQEIAGKTIAEYKQSTGASGAMQTALADTDWNLGLVQSDGVNTASLDLEDTDAYSMVQEIANTFDLEVETIITVAGNHVTDRTVNLVAHRGSDVGRTFRYAKDLTEIRRTVGTDHPITRLWVYGKTESGSDGSEGSRASIDSVNGGKKYIDAPADVLAAWGRRGPNGTRLPYEGTVTFSEVEDPAELLRLGKGQLTKQSKATVSYEGSVVALGHGGLDADNAMVGDTVRIIDDAFPGGLRLEGRILKLERNLLDGPASTTITLGTIVDPITKQNAKVQNTVQQLWDGKGAWDDAANLTGGYLDGVINGLNERMNLTGGYVYWDKGVGIIVYDKPRREDGSDRDATMAIQIGGGYFRIANSRKSDGTWNWRTMGTGGGLVADVITAGILRGGSAYFNLNTGEVSFNDGIIRSADNSTYWDLGNGTFSTDGTISGGTIRGSSISGTTISGGTISGTTISAGTISGNEIRGGSIYGTVMDNSNVNSSTISQATEGSSFVSSDGNDWIKFDSGFAGIQLYAAGAHLDLQENGLFQLQANNTDSRVDASSTYVSIAKGATVDQCHVQVFSSQIGIVGPDIYFNGNVHGLPTTSTAAASPTLQAALMTAAEQGTDLSDPDAYLNAPATVEELNNTQLHAVLRLLVDGQQDEAKQLLDEYQSQQRVWTQRELRDLAIDGTGRENLNAKQTQ